jgi:hypothetical protein
MCVGFVHLHLRQFFLADNPHDIAAFALPADFFVPQRLVDVDDFADTVAAAPAADIGFAVPAEPGSFYFHRITSFFPFLPLLALFCLI